MKTLCCPNSDCSESAVIRHGFYKTKSGKRRRYLCKSCGKTFCLNRGTPYYCLQHRRSTFDEVASLSVEGVNKSAIARVKSISWNTVDRWLEKAAACCRRFNDRVIKDLEITELQADELRTFVGSKERSAWVFTAIDVWSRLWVSSRVGRRSYKNTRALLRDVRKRMIIGNYPLIVTDGFEFYARVVWEIFGPTCLYGQVIKTRRNDRITTVKRRQIIGAVWRFEEALLQSEDSTTLNTSFIERLNLTIRQGSAYLTRRSIAHSRWRPRLDDHIELLRCHYNFIRPHRALKFGSEIRTPAMQAGLMKKKLSFREVFSWTNISICLTIRFVTANSRHANFSRAA